MSMDPKLPSNPTAMLMQAQERKNLVNKLISLKCSVNQKEPSNYAHLCTGRVNRRNDEVKKINAENQQMLKKIMGIMSRKPVKNGLKGAQLKKQLSTEELNNNSITARSITPSGYDGNLDLEQVQKNSNDNCYMQNRFSFEIMAGTSQSKQGSSRSPFQQKSNATSSRILNEYSCDTARLIVSPSEITEAVKVQQEVANETPIDLPEVNRFGKKPLAQKPDDSKAQSQNTENNYSEIRSPRIFDKNLQDNDPMVQERPDSKTLRTLGQDIISIQPENSFETVQHNPKVRFEKSIEEQTFQTAALDKPSSHFGSGSRRLYPGQITLNHTVRKKEVQRINRENKIMLSKLREVKPAVESSRTQVIHAMKAEQYRRNVSKFRIGGKSQPRPSRQRNISPLATEQQLPEINKNISDEAKQMMMETGVVRTRNGSRRTSQANRMTYLDGKTEFAVPFTHHTGMRHYLTSQNSNNTESTNFHIHNASTQQESSARNELNGNSTFYPHRLRQEGFLGRDQTVNKSIASEDSINSQKPRAARRQTSYLSKLKKSPLLSAINHQQNIPRSIVNRVIGRREDQVRVNFRKYGELPRTSIQGITDHLYTGSSIKRGQKNNISSFQNTSMMSSIAKPSRDDATNQSLQAELNRLYNAEVEASPSVYQHIDVHIKGKLDMLQTESDVDEVQKSDTAPRNPLNDSIMQCHAADEDGSDGQKKNLQVVVIQDEQKRALQVVTGQPVKESDGVAFDQKSYGSPQIPIGNGSRSFNLRKATHKKHTSNANLVTKDPHFRQKAQAEQKKFSAISLLHTKSPAHDSQRIQTQIQGNRTTQNLAILKNGSQQLGNDVQGYKNSVPFAEDDCSILKQSDCGKAEHSHFNEDVVTRKNVAQEKAFKVEQDGKKLLQVNHKNITYYNSSQMNEMNFSSVQATRQLDNMSSSHQPEISNMAVGKTSDVNDGQPLEPMGSTNREGKSQQEHYTPNQMSDPPSQLADCSGDKSNSIKIGRLECAKSSKPTESPNTLETSHIRGGSQIIIGPQSTTEASGNQVVKTNLNQEPTSNKSALATEAEKNSIHAITESLAQTSQDEGVPTILKGHSGRVSTLREHESVTVTEQASNQSRKINLSKEDIILSQLSSMKNLDSDLQIDILTVPKEVDINPDSVGEESLN